MSQDRHIDRTDSDEQRRPEFYLPGTHPTSAARRRVERFLKRLFGRRGRMRAGRLHERTDR